MNEAVDFFKNFASIIIGISGLGAGLFYFLKNRKRKILEYVISNKTALFNKLHSKIKIFFNEQEINKDACLSILTINNIGNEPIKEEEFEKNKPLKVNFSRKDGTPVRIFDVEIYKSNPSDFEIEFDYTDLEGTLSIKPVLFNPKDFVTLKLISTEFEQISVSGRIIGGRIVNGEKRKKRKENQHFYLAIMALLISLGGVLFNSQTEIVPYISLFVVAIGLVFTLITIAINLKSWREDRKNLES